MNAPQVTLIVLLAISGGHMLFKHGEPRDGNHSFGAWLTAAGIQCGILYWGGFFG